MKGDKDKSLEFLERIAQNYVDDTRMARNRSEWSTSLTGELRGTQPGAAAQPGEPCKFFAKGHCKNGESCPQSHTGGGNASAGGDSRGRQAKKDKKGDKKGRGKGKNGSGSNRDKSKSGTTSGSSTDTPCYDHADGKCNRPHCRFKHRPLTPHEEKIRKERREASGRSPSPAAASRVCRDYLNGECKNKGGNCDKGKHPGSSGNESRSPKSRRKKRTKKEKKTDDESPAAGK